MVQFKAKKGAPKDFKNPKHLKKSLVKSAAPQESIPNENETLLLTEIKALGGDESDLKLIKDSRSDSEFEEEEIKSEDKVPPFQSIVVIMHSSHIYAFVSKSLVNDLQAFMTGELKMKISAPQKSKTKPERNAEKSLGLNKAINDKKMEKKSVENKDLSSKKDSTRVSPKDSKKNKAKEVDNKPKAKEPLKLTAEDYKIPEFKIANAKKMVFCNLLLAC